MVLRWQRNYPGTVSGDGSVRKIVDRRAASGKRVRDRPSVAILSRRNRTTLSTPDRNPRPTVVVALLVIYLFWLIATPYKRFDVLDSIHLERWIVGAALLAWMLERPRLYLRNGVVISLAALLAGMIVSYVFSEYRDSAFVEHWASEYWKLIVLFFFTAYGVRQRDQLALFLIGIALVSLVYQAYSWFDFLGGGSYVYQQGMKRMIGVWSGGGLGAANAWGSFALYSIPLGVFWRETAVSRASATLGVVLVLMSISSIIFSGTRAAFVVVAVYAAVRWRRQLVRPGRLLLVAAVLATVWTYLPADYQERFKLIWVSENTSELTVTDEIAVRSGEARLEGLKDGWRLFLERPLLGYGPGASVSARVRLHPGTPPDEIEQLHNLYGQLLSELGIVGTVGFAFLILAIFRATSTGAIVARDQAFDATLVANCVRSLLALLLIYGAFSHSLYQQWWLIVAGLAAALEDERGRSVFRLQERVR